MAKFAGRARPPRQNVTGDVSSVNSQKPEARRDKFRVFVYRFPLLSFRVAPRVRSRLSTFLITPSIGLGTRSDSRNSKRAPA